MLYSCFNIPSDGSVVAITVVVTLVLAVPVGVALGCSGMWCLMKSQGYKRDRPSDSGKKKTTELTGVIYEEPVAVAPVETVFSLSDNQAYGQPVAVAPVETVFSLSDNQAYGQVK